MASTPPTSVRRWRRFGHDRLYVTGGDQAKLGWYDLQTGQAHRVPSERAAEFWATVHRWVRTYPDVPTPLSNVQTPRAVHAPARHRRVAAIE